MWWSREKRDHLPDRIKAIQRTNDPTTYADEILSIVRIVMPVLLIATGLLGAMSYWKFFSMSFPAEVSFFLAAVLTVIIELSKLKGSLWSLRIPMFHGRAYIGRSPANTLIWLGCLVLAVIGFTMSVKNSTQGGEQLALLMAQEKNERPFIADTKTIDEQITLLHQANTNAPTVKWKGKMYYQDAKSVRANAQSIESLQRQREEAVKMQRADWEKSSAIKEGQTNWAARLVLASGGWLEGIQLVLILIAVACERVLDGRNAPAIQSSVQNIDTKTSIKTPIQPQPIGFSVGQDGNVRRAERENTVTHLPNAVTQQSDMAAIFAPEEALRWFETELRREPSNLRNKFANRETVVQRIHTKLGRAQMYISAVDAIPQDAATRFEMYLKDDLFPEIDPLRPYPESDQLISLINQKKIHDGHNGEV